MMSKPVAIRTVYPDGSILRNGNCNADAVMVNGIITYELEISDIGKAAV